MKLTGIVFALGLTLSVSAFAQPAPDHPDNGETFSQFFQRITGNHRVPGISLEASPGFQSRFLEWYRESSWVGVKNQAMTQLQNQGIDIWFDLFKEQAPMRFVLPTPEIEAVFTAEYNKQRADSCPTQCRELAVLKTTAWSDWNTYERGAFTLTYVVRAPVFGGERLVDILTKLYDVDTPALTSTTLARILPHDAFVQAVRDLGWGGPVYFRGITAPDPKDPSRKWIVIDGDMLRTLTAHHEPVLQMLEYAGILTHELAHACQDLEAKSLGMDLEIRSMEGAVLIEGQAEALAEAAMVHASALQGARSPLALYSAAQGLELMQKDLPQEPESMPYKVGIAIQKGVWLGPPALSARDTRLEMYKTILLQESLDAMLAHIEGRAGMVVSGLQSQP